MMKSLALAAVLGLTVQALGAAPVLARTEQVAKVSSPAPETDQRLLVVVEADPRVDLARRIMVVKGADLEKVVRASLTSGFDAAIGDADSVEITWMRKAAGEIIGEHLRTFVETIQNMMAANFSAEELTVMAELYESPIGASIARKELELGEQQMTALRQLQVGFMTELGTKYCAQFDCKTSAGKLMSGAR